MCIDHTRTDNELFCHLGITQPMSNQAQHLRFSGGQPGGIQG